VVGNKTMRTRIAIGVGCRLGSSAYAIEALVRQALDRARSLGLDLVFLARDALREEAPFVQTRSIRSETQFGVPSVAEAAALAGAGPGGVLIFTRIVSQGVTCAIAQSRDDAS
jgi:cobalt-precorrin 5A hydrolase